MKAISFKTFNVKSIMISAIMVVSIFSISLSSCQKDKIPVTATLRTKEILLNANTGNTINGKAIISENADHSFNVKVALQNTVKDTVMIMHIHNGSITAPGTIAIPLTSIKGTGAQALGETLNVKTGTSASGTTLNLTYDSIIKHTRYVDVHYSAAQIKRIVASGNI